jgi:hypothetical protein
LLFTSRPHIDNEALLMRRPKILIARPFGLLISLAQTQDYGIVNLEENNFVVQPPMLMQDADSIG